MRWENKLPDREGLWACSIDGKTIGQVHTFKVDSWYNPDFYWCRISDIPEISPPERSLTFEDLMEYMKKGKNVTIKCKDSGKMYVGRITSIELFGDESCLLYTTTGNFTKKGYDFYSAS